MKVFRFVFAIWFFGCSMAIRAPISVRAQAATAPLLVDAIQKIKQSVVPIVCYKIAGESGELVSVEGTGFFAAPDGTFITADHVISGITNPRRQAACPLTGIYLPQSAGWNVEQQHIFAAQIYGFTINDCRRNSDLDIAICKSRYSLQEGHSIHPVTFQTVLQPDGTPVAFTGFPLQYHVPLSSVGTISGYAETRDDNLGPRTIIIDKGAWPGASGSPIYTADGKVIGLLKHRGVNDGSGRALGIPSRLIQQFLAQSGTAAGGGP